MHFRLLALVTPILWIAATACAEVKPPGVGDKAPAFQLGTPGGQQVELNALLKQGPAVVVVLRGYPGYQCPLCTRQVGSLLSKKQAFADKGAQVVLIYPGPKPGLADNATEFLKEADLPKHFTFAIDPGYKFTNRYGLRWDAPRETAYPSVFVVGKDGRIQFAHISRTHGNRAQTEDILKALP